MAQASIDEESSRKIAEAAAPNHKDEELGGASTPATAAALAGATYNKNNKFCNAVDKFHLSGFRNPTHGVVELADGQKYNWNSRQHRKLLYKKKHHHHHWYHTRFLSFEPHNVTWWNIWIGFIANTLWIINGAFCVWPTSSVYDATVSANASFGTGIAGSFLFIVTAYLSIVEVINQNHQAIVESSDEQSNATKDGEPKTNKIEEDDDTQQTSHPPYHYSWWTWHPNIREHISVFSSYLFLVCTILFFIPACLQASLSDLSFGSDIFWNYTLQIIASVGFVLCGYFTMIESIGSYNPLYKVKPHYYHIGYWIGFFNLLGGIGFLLCPILLLPGYVCGNSPSSDDLACSSSNFDTLDTWGGGFSTFFGSILFWIAGVLECIEFASTRPIYLW